MSIGPASLSLAPKSSHTPCSQALDWQSLANRQDPPAGAAFVFGMRVRSVAEGWAQAALPGSWSLTSSEGNVPLVRAAQPVPNAPAATPRLSTRISVHGRLREWVHTEYA